MRKVLECIKCGERYEPYPIKLSCPKCGGPLIPKNIPGIDGLRRELLDQGVWTFRKYLISASGERLGVTLGEGLTPLIEAKNLKDYLGIRGVILKDESRNPLGTFIDRGSATLVTTALNSGYNRLSIASLGDLGISVSAYARRAKIRTHVIMPHSVSPSKAYQTLILAHKVEFTQTYEDALKKVARLKESLPVTPTNPYLLDGYRTIYYEIFLKLSKHPSTLIVPIGDGALLTMVWQALRELGGSSRVIGVKGCSSTPILKDISVDKPLLQDAVNEVIRDSNGLIITVCEGEVLSSIKLLAELEGMLIEPTGASSLAALIKLHSMGELSRDDEVVVLLTGSSLSDTSILRLIADKHVKYFDEIKIGYTKLKILEILTLQGPLHPYAIWKILRNSYGVKVGLRTLYQHMEELERLGFVRVSSFKSIGGRIRKIYEVTTKGLMILK